MRNRKLTREEAIEEYLACRIRIYEALHIFQITDEIIKDEYQPHNELGHAPGAFMGSLRTVLVGLFASLVDKQKEAINVFDVWRELFPEKKDRIDETWQKIEPQIDLMRVFRNNVAFHVNKDLQVYFGTYYEFRNRSAEVTIAMQEFLGLAAELQEYEQTALPDLRTEIEPPLRKAFPRVDDAGLEELKDYFVPR